MNDTSFNLTGDAFQAFKAQYQAGLHDGNELQNNSKFLCFYRTGIISTDSMNDAPQ